MGSCDQIPRCLSCPEALVSTPEKIVGDLAVCGRRILALYGDALPDFLRAHLEESEQGFRLFEMSDAEPSPLEESAGIGAAVCRHERIDALLAVGGPAVLAFARRIAESFCRQNPVSHGLTIIHLPRP